MRECDLGSRLDRHRAGTDLNMAIDSYAHKSRLYVSMGQMLPSEGAARQNDGDYVPLTLNS